MENATCVKIIIIKCVYGYSITRIYFDKIDFERIDNKMR